MQDVLELGSEHRMNVPGTAQGNWTWRLEKSALTPQLAGRLRNLTKTYGR
jgi:4-alpha-glucanotransferase